MPLRRGGFLGKRDSVPASALPCLALPCRAAHAQYLIYAVGEFVRLCTTGGPRAMAPYRSLLQYSSKHATNQLVHVNQCVQGSLTQQPISTPSPKQAGRPDCAQ